MTIKSAFKLVAAAAVALAALGPASAVLAADAHAHGDGAAPVKLHLDHGRKWATDDALRRGMEAIRDSVHRAPAPLHKATAKPEAYAELGRRVETQVGRIVRECKLAPDADAQLHIVVAEIIAGADAMKGARDPVTGRAGLVRVDGALKSYAKYFDHPNWTAATK
jgi:hypothetical protein